MRCETAEWLRPIRFANWVWVVPRSSKYLFSNWATAEDPNWRLKTLVGFFRTF